MKAILTVLLAVLMTGCGASSARTLHDVTYVVSSQYACRSVGLTYQNSSGGTEQKTVDLSPTPAGTTKWEMRMMVPDGSFLYMSAQMGHEYDHDITVEIFVDGELAQHATSTATYGIASASATAR